MKRQAQSGSLLTLVMLGILAASVLATIAFTSYYQIARGTQDTVSRAQSAALLTQAAYTLATEATDSDGDGVSEPPAGTEALNGAWKIPATSGAPKADAWGSAFLYCPWDNGSDNTSTGRLTGTNPGLPSTIQFTLISAGPNKTFNIACADQANMTPSGDDGMRTLSVAQLNQGVGGTYFYGDPVISVSALPASGSPTGILRITLDTKIPYLWTGVAWIPLTAVPDITGVSDGVSCAAYPRGTLVRNADSLFMCASTGWKTI